MTLHWLLVIYLPAGACVGAGVDLVTAADLRYCSRDAYFSVKVNAVQGILFLCLKRFPPPNSDKKQLTCDNLKLH